MSSSALCWSVLVSVCCAQPVSATSDQDFLQSHRIQSPQIPGFIVTCKLCQISERIFHLRLQLLIYFKGDKAVQQHKIIWMALRDYRDCKVFFVELLILSFTIQHFAKTILLSTKLFARKTIFACPVLTAVWAPGSFGCCIVCRGRHCPGGSTWWV